MSSPSTAFIGENYDYMHSLLMLNIGVMAGVLITGGLLCFGISCIFLLSGSRNPDTLKQHRLLRVHVIALLFFGTGYIVTAALLFNFPIISVHMPQSQAIKYTNLLTFFIDLIPIFIASLTDGLLVWRCYMIHRSFLSHSDSLWQNIVWIFPAFLWCITIGTGYAAAALILVPPPKKPGSISIQSKIQATAAVSNVILNIYTTSFISIRLLKHRRMLVAILGQKAPDAYLNIVNILLESAAINVPLTLALATGIGHSAAFVPALAPSMIMGQVFASVIIIHQVAVGRAFNRKQEEELSKFTATVQMSGNQVDSANTIKIGELISHEGAITGKREVS